MRIPLTPVRFFEYDEKIYARNEGVVCGDRRFTYGEFCSRLPPLWSKWKIRCLACIPNPPLSPHPFIGIIFNFKDPQYIHNFYSRQYFLRYFYFFLVTIFFRPNIYFHSLWHKFWHKFLWKSCG
jgi:hypothetical protein